MNTTEIRRRVIRFVSAAGQCEPERSTRLSRGRDILRRATFRDVRRRLGR